MNQGQKRIQKEYRDLSKNPIENIIILPNPDNFYEWHYVILGTEKPYNSGFYYGILTLPNDYPYKAEESFCKSLISLAVFKPIPFTDFIVFRSSDKIASLICWG